MKWLFCISTLCLTTQLVLGQKITEITLSSPCPIPVKERTKLVIKPVTILDTFLIQQLELFIQEESRKDSLFRSGLGYMQVFASQDVEAGIDQRYYINNEFHSLKETDNDPAFPPFYSYVAGRLVLIYMQVWDGFICYRYSNNSKKALQRKLESFLPKSKKLVARDKEGKIFIRDKHFRIETVKLHGGKYIYIYQNRPPRVVAEQP